MKRLHRVVPLAALFVACHRPVEISGLYITQDGAGTLFPCDDARVAVVVQDSALAARYRATVSAHEPLFVRLRGIRGHSGSPKGGGQRFFDVQEILEVRPRLNGECPGVAQPIAPLLPN